MPFLAQVAHRRLALAVGFALSLAGGPALAAVTAQQVVEAALVSATQIADANERGLVISTIAEERAKAGDWASVDRILSGIEEAPIRDDALTQTALIAAGAGDVEKAMTLVGRLSDEDGKSDAAASVATALVRQGSVSNGIAVARAVADPEQRFRALVEVAPRHGGAARSGRRPGAGRCLAGPRPDRRSGPARPVAPGGGPGCGGAQRCAAGPGHCR